MTTNDPYRIVVEDAHGLPLGYGRTADDAMREARREFPAAHVARVRDALRPDLDRAGSEAGLVIIAAATSSR